MNNTIDELRIKRENKAIEKQAEAMFKASHESPPPQADMTYGSEPVCAATDGDDDTEEDAAMTAVLRATVKNYQDIGVEVPPHLHRYMENPPPPPPTVEPKKQRVIPAVVEPKKPREVTPTVEPEKKRKTPDEMREEREERNAKLAEKRAARQAVKDEKSEKTLTPEKGKRSPFFPTPDAIITDPIVMGLPAGEFRMFFLMFGMTWRDKRPRSVHYFGAVRQAGNGPLTVRDLAEVTGINLRSAQRYIVNLQKAGLIEQRDINGASYLCITDFDGWFMGTRYADSAATLVSSPTTQVSSPATLVSSPTTLVSSPATLVSSPTLTANDTDVAVPDDDETEEAPEVVDLTALEGSTTQVTDTLSVAGVNPRQRSSREVVEKK